MPKKAAAPPRPAPAPKPPAARPAPSKISGVIAMLGREHGASLAELADATGWQPHTVRAALSGLRSKGHMLEKASLDGVTLYRIDDASSSARR